MMRWETESSELIKQTYDNSLAPVCVHQEQLRAEFD